MRRVPVSIIAAFVALLWGGASANLVADDGFWVTVAAGAANAPSPNDYAEFSLDSPHAPVVVNQLTGGFTATATTGGGYSTFSGLGTPVLLPTGDGYATVIQAGLPAPPDGLPRFTSGTLASVAPQVADIPSGINLLSVDLAADGPSGKHILTVDLTDADGNPLGQVSVSVPKNGWWVIGLGTADVTPSTPGEGPSGGQGNGNGNPIGNGNGGNGGGGGAVTTPEPGSAILLGLGGLGALGWRRRRLR